MKHAKGTRYERSQSLCSKAEIRRNGKGCKDGQSLSVKLDEKSCPQQPLEIDCTGGQPKTFACRSSYSGLAIPDDVFTDLFSRRPVADSCIPQVAANSGGAFSGGVGA